jgi:hypothetical protein
MIPADVTRAYLEEIYDFKVTTGKTLRTVDGRPQWVLVMTFSATCLGKPLKGSQEILADKATPELIEARTQGFIESLKMRILTLEEAESHG